MALMVSVTLMVRDPGGLLRGLQVLGAGERALGQCPGCCRWPKALCSPGHRSGAKVRMDAAKTRALWQEGAGRGWPVSGPENPLPSTEGGSPGHRVGPEAAGQPSDLGRWLLSHLTFDPDH